VHQRIEVSGDFRFDQLQLSGKDFARGAVDGNDVAFLDDDVAHRELLGFDIHVDRFTARDARNTEAASDDHKPFLDVGIPAVDLIDRNLARNSKRIALIDDNGSYSYADLAERALSQLRRAMAQGRAGAAASWMRVHDRLTARAEVEAAREVKAAEAARRAAERAAAEVRAVAAARAEAADGLVRDVTTLALGAAGPGTAVARAALDAELARLERASGALDAAGISHDSDGSHPVDPPPDDP
jgi:hypothetical protein